MDEARMRVFAGPLTWIGAALPVSLLVVPWGLASGFRSDTASPDTTILFSYNLAGFVPNPLGFESLSPSGSTSAFVAFSLFYASLVACFVVAFLVGRQVPGTRRFRPLELIGMGAAFGGHMAAQVIGLALARQVMIDELPVTDGYSFSLTLPLGLLVSVLAILCAGIAVAAVQTYAPPAQTDGASASGTP